MEDSIKTGKRSKREIIENRKRELIKWPRNDFLPRKAGRKETRLENALHFPVRYQDMQSNKFSGSLIRILNWKMISTEICS